jgi:hypothetical protein
VGGLKAAATIITFDLHKRYLQRTHSPDSQAPL